jgi:hypothetical protein
VERTKKTKQINNLAYLLKIYISDVDFFNKKKLAKSAS